jgi:hypothetical protein
LLTLFVSNFLQRIECTYDHFNTNSGCPSCGRNLKPTDFIQLAIANTPPVSGPETIKTTFQTMFTKVSPTSAELTQQDMCHRVMKHIEDGKRATRFLMKQFMVHAKTASQQTGNLGRAYHQIKHQFMQLQQSSQQTIAELQDENANLRSMMAEKDDQLKKFRDCYARDGLQRIPPSAHSTGSHSSRGSRGSNSDAGQQHHHHQRSQQTAPPPTTPPLQAYILQQQVRGREKERAKEYNAVLAAQRRNTIHGPDIDSVITPIVPPPSSRHSVRPLVNAIPPSSTPRIGHHHGNNGVPPSGSTSFMMSQQHRKRSHGSALPDGGSTQQQRRTTTSPFSGQHHGTQQPPPGSSYTSSSANPYNFSTARRSR